MIKKLKLGLLFALLSVVFVGNSVFADDLTYSADTNVNLTSTGVFKIQASSTATSIAVTATTLTAVVPASSTFIFVSPDRYTLTNDLGLSQSCNNSQNSVTVTGATGGTTVVFTPTTTVCTFGGSGGLNTGGTTTTTTTTTTSGSSTSTVAQSSTPVTLTISPEVTMTTVSTGCSGGNKYNTSTGALCMNTVVAANIPGCGNRTSGFSTASGTSCAGNVVGSSQSSYNFGTTTLKNGSRGEGVKELQRFLNAKLMLGLVVDGKLGPKTIAVIKKWQKEKGLVSDGLVGAKTKAMMNAEAVQD